MSRRGRRGEARQSRGQYTEAVLLEEKQLPSVFNQSAPSQEEPTRPLRLLDQFELFTASSDERSPQRLESLSQGAVNGELLQASGMVLEHKLAETSLEEARRAAYINVRIRRIKDWVVDHSSPPSIWVVTDAAWYRLIAPSPDYAPDFQPNMRKLELLKMCSEAVQINRRASFEDALASIPHLLHQPGYSDTAGDRRTLVSECLEEAGFLAPQLSVLLGRHAGESGLVKALAEKAGFHLASATYSGRPLMDVTTDGPSANVALRPAPVQDFQLEPDLQPAVLMLWDFFQIYRELLRLPPFPLKRLELAFLDAHENEREKGLLDYQESCLLKDLHLCLLRLLEDKDIALQEAPTMAGFGSAAELGPQDVYRPLLGATWPELVREKLLKHCEQTADPSASALAEELRVKEYGKLNGACRLAILELMVSITADTELVRDYMHDRSLEAVDEKLSRGTPLGCDDSGSRYFQLASTSGIDRLFVEVRSHEVHEGRSGEWGWYELAQIPHLLRWLESGSRSEQELAEDLFETFQAHLTAWKLQEKRIEGEPPAVRLESPSDGYTAAIEEPSSLALLREEVGTLFGAVRFWEKDGDWLKAQAAVLKELEAARTGRDCARLLWLVEDLLYTDLLKGTGWGRKRTKYREQLEAARTVAQVAVEACQMAIHCRRELDLGFMTGDEFREALRTARAQPNFVPTLGSPAVLLRSGYLAHVQQARPPPDALSAPLPRSWSFAEPIVVREAKYAYGNWQRPSWQGKFADSPAPPHQAAHDLILACFIVERQSGEPESSKAEAGQGEIDWSGFSFQTGFKQPRFSAPTANPGGLISSNPAANPSQLGNTSESLQTTRNAATGPSLLSELADDKRASSRDAGSEPNVATGAVRPDSNVTSGIQASKAEPSQPSTKDAVTIKEEPGRGLTTKTHAEESHAHRHRSGELSKGQQDTVMADLNGNDSQASLPESSAEPNMPEEGLPMANGSEELTKATQNLATAATNPVSGPQYPVLGGPDRSGVAIAQNCTVKAEENGEKRLPEPASGEPAKETVAQNIAASAEGKWKKRPLEKAYVQPPGEIGTQKLPAIKVEDAKSLQQAPTSAVSTVQQSLQSKLNEPANGNLSSLLQKVAQSSGATLSRPGLASMSMQSELAPTAHSRLPVHATNPEGRSVMMELSRAAGRHQAGGVPSEAAAADSAPGLRRSSRVRTEVTMPDFEAGGDWGDGPPSGPPVHMTRSSAANWQVPSSHSPYPAQVQPVWPVQQRQEDDSAFDDAAAVRFWRVERDLAAVVFYVRKLGAASVEYFLPPTVFASAGKRSWNRGTIVKMPAFGTLARSAATPNTRWYTGVLQASFIPVEHSAEKDGSSVTVPDSKPQNQPAGLLSVPQAPFEPSVSKAAATTAPLLQPGISAPGSTPLLPPAAPLEMPASSVALQTAAAHPSESLLPRASERVESQPRAEPCEAQTSAAVTLPEAHGTSQIVSSALKAVQQVPVQPGSSLPAMQASASVLSSLLTQQSTGGPRPGSSMAQLQGGSFLTPGSSSQSTQGLPANQGPRPGARLSDLMPRNLGSSAAFSNVNGVLRSGGPGGPTDPWKALLVTWDASTMLGWPPRVSPWEVLEDTGGAMRSANEKAYQAAIAKQRAEAAARRGVSPTTAGLAQLAANPAYSAAHLPYRPLPTQMGAQHRPQISAVASQQGPSAVYNPSLYTSTAGPVHGGHAGGWPAGAQMPGMPFLSATPFPWPPGAPGGAAYLPYFMPRPQQPQISANQRPVVPTSRAQGGAEERAAARKRKAMEIEEKPAPKTSNEGYRDRWLAKRPRPNPNTWLSGFCSACEKADGLMSCMGPCLRAFHPACVGLSSQPADPGTWFCPECESGRVRCFLCGEFSSGFGDPTFRKCSLGVCGRFYHLSCASQAPLAQFARKGGHFRCPQHYCMSCGKSGDGMDMAKCIRCPTAYHSACMSSTSARRLHPHSKVVLCEKHKEGEPPPGYTQPPSSNNVALTDLPGANALEPKPSDGAPRPDAPKPEASEPEAPKPEVPGPEADSIAQVTVGGEGASIGAMTNILSGEKQPDAS